MYNIYKWAKIFNSIKNDQKYNFLGLREVPVKMYDLILAKASDVIKDIPDSQVVIIGVGTVFAGLVCIVLLCKIIGLFCGKNKKTTTTAAAVKAAPKVQAAEQPIENRQQIIAAVSAAVAEELGTDVPAIRILSFKKI